MANKAENPIGRIAIFLAFWGAMYFINEWAGDSWLWWGIKQIIIWSLRFSSILCVPFIIGISLVAIGGGCYCLYTIAHKTQWNKDKQNIAKVGAFFIVFGIGLLCYFFLAI